MIAGFSPYICATTPATIGAEYESEYAKKVADIEKEYAEKVRKCNERLQEIQLFIDNLYDYNEREVCQLYYILMHDLQSVAMKLHYSKRRIEQIHGTALLNLLEIHKKIIENGGKPLF